MSVSKKGTKYYFSEASASHPAPLPNSGERGFFVPSPLLGKVKAGLFQNNIWCKILFNILIFSIYESENNP